MRRSVTSRFAALTTALSALAFISVAAAQPPPIQAGAAALMDAGTGTVLYRKAMHESRPVASTTKVMTALLALELCEPDEQLLVGQAVEAVDGARLGLRPGDFMTIDDLLAAMLVGSANDAAVAIAEHIDGSAAKFAERMNARAKQLGATNTHFTNPNGLPDPGHYSSAYDLALFTREALKYPRFQELVSSRFATVALPDAPSGERTLKNHNKLLWQADFVDGVKTGWVRASGHCLVASGANDGWRLIAVVLDSPDMYGEALRLLEYGFSNYEYKVYARRGDAVGRVQIKGGRIRSVPALSENMLSAVIGPGLAEDCRLEVALDRLRAPVARGDLAGEARLISGEKVIARTPLRVSQSVPRSPFIVFSLWALRVIIVLTVIALLARTYAKAVKARRPSRGLLPAQGGGHNPRRPGPG